MEKIIEIPFGAFDSELKGWEYTIPEGMEAKIENGKIIVREKEGEDEIIRNRIIGYLKQDIEEYPERKERIGEMLAWLEKQKEQQELPLMDGDTDLYFDEWKQRFKGNPTKRQCFEEGIRYSERKQKEQKPAEWSDTEELVFKDICKHLLAEGYSGWVDLLRALHNRESQLKLQWSEEDEKRRNNVLRLITEANDKWIKWQSSSPFSAEILWLKSLRPQPHWKPSEEQMEWLEQAVRLSTDKSTIHRIVLSLYNDLKELK